jgi:ring-1,2-phenylacetyl-CoA epoxidase subunit PaaE
MSVPHFHPLTVSEVRRETATCVSVAFHIPEHLLETFRYQAGQYLTLRAQIGGEEVRRSYSLCSSPVESDVRVAIKLVAGGKFSGYANSELRVGDTLDAMPPMGNFTVDFDPSNKRNYVGFAAGSGITPVLSLIKTALSTEPSSSFTLIYGNQYVQSIIFKEEIEALKNKYIGRFQVVHVLSKERMESDLNYGRIDGEKCSQLFGHIIPVNHIDHFFLCGPEEMIHCVKDQLVVAGVATDAIHFELFTTSTASANNAKQSYKETHQANAGKLCNLTIKVDDRSFDLVLPYDGDTILDAALKHGADLPFACKGGVCCTCKAKVMEGTVDMEVNYALEKEEVEQGFVLSCQAHPTSERVIIDFDQR